MADTRKDKRAPVSLKVRFKSATVDEFIEHYSKDVSRGGIYIKSSQPLPVGTLLKFQFQLKDESALIRGVGRVVWTRAEEDAAEEQPAGMGIKFIKMDNESRAVVERIIESHAPEGGSYESGRYNATSAEPFGSDPPTNQEEVNEAFFPSLPPAELPPPEDRTAVRQATELLAAVLAENGTDEEAAREAEARAEEARRRTQEIESQRRAELERRRASERAGSLPSMIVDPALSPRTGRPSEQEPDLTPLPVPGQAAREASDRAAMLAAAADEPTTEPPDAPAVEPGPLLTPTPTLTTSVPGQQPRRRSWFPVAVIASLLLIALVVALRGGPRELSVSPAETEPIRENEKPTETKAQEVPPAVQPAEPPSEELRPAAAEEPEVPPPSEPAATLVPVDVVTAPRGAEVSVGDELRGVAPITLELPVGKPVVLRVRAPGYSELTHEVTPKVKSDAIKLRLVPLPYVVRIESTPPGASVNVGGLRGTTPVELQLSEPPAAQLPVSARLTGYALLRTRVEPHSFVEQEGAMRALVSLKLTPQLPGAASKEGAAVAPKQPAPASEGEPRPAAKPEPEPAPKQAEPEERPIAPPSTPKEDIPDNPFGE